MFAQADKRFLMSAEEYKQYFLLPEKWTIYRGVTSYNSRNIKALSRTLDRDKAEWFAHRFGEDGTVYEAKIAKDHVLAFFTSCNEAEVVVNPAYLQNITEAENMENGFTIQL